MTHFRSLVAIILREFIAQTLGKQITEVDADDFMWYSLTLRKTTACNGIRDTVQCIMIILTGKHAKTQDVGDLLAKWITRVLPLTKMIFGGTVIDKQFTLTTDDSYPYNIQRHGWKTRTRNSVFDPHEATLRDIDYIYRKFNFPENPLSNAEPPKRQREHIDNMQLLSPPRRVRRCGIEQLSDCSKACSPTLTQGEEVRSQNDRLLEEPACSSQDPCSTDRGRPIRNRKRPAFYYEEQTPVRRNYGDKSCDSAICTYNDLHNTKACSPTLTQGEEVRSQNDRLLEEPACSSQDPCSTDRGRPIRNRKRPAFYYEEQTQVRRKYGDKSCDSAICTYNDLHNTKACSPTLTQGEEVRSQNDRLLEEPACSSQDPCSTDRGSQKACSPTLTQGEEVRSQNDRLLEEPACSSQDPCSTDRGSQVPPTLNERGRPVRTRRPPAFYYQEQTPVVYYDVYESDTDK